MNMRRSVLWSTDDVGELKKYLVTLKKGSLSKKRLKEILEESFLWKKYCSAMKNAYKLYE